MQPFLYTVAAQLYQRFRTQLHELAIVFPNRRQAIFFQNHLMHIASAPVFMPRLLTIEEMVAASTHLQIADPLFQSFALYESFSEVAKEQGEADIPSFDVFYPIGETLLKDFTEIDSYLADIEKICVILYDLESIDMAFGQLSEEQRDFLRTFWKGTLDKGAIQEKFLKLWKRLPFIYNRFHTKLQQAELTTLGRVYRNLSLEEKSPPDFLQHYAHTAFVGFNAFNKAEESFIKRWIDAGFASLWLDADDYYVSQTDQEAGYFMRRNLHKAGLKNEMPLQNSLQTSHIPLQVIAVEGDMDQAKAIAPWWARLYQAKPEQCGILLADESLLIPVLQSLPNDWQAVNLTMGYPLKQSPVYSFINLFFEIQMDLDRHAYQSVHHRLATQWMLHPFCDWPADVVEKMKQRMLKENWVRIPVNHLASRTESAALVFSRMMANLELFDRLKRILELALNREPIASDALTIGTCHTAWKALQTLKQLFATLKPEPDLAFTARLLTRQLAGLRVPFEGEPLQGIQIMGLLESRGLDFEHLLILGGSEGSLPRIQPPNSFLPQNVRRAFDLPVPEHQDAIFAYVFYRLLHKASSVTVVYNALVSDNSTGEVSRFVKQLAYESGIVVSQENPTNTTVSSVSPPITIHKDEKVMNRLQRYLDHDNAIPLSPTAINSYLTCRLQFYFKYLARLQKPDELEEAVQASAVGKVVHKLMELLYAEAVSKHGANITAEVVQWMVAHREDLIETAFRKSWRNTEIEGPFRFSGELHVVRAIVLKYAEMLLEYDAAYAPFRVVEFEVEMKEPFAIDEMRKVMLKGFVDRVDEKDGTYRMVDYKTGSDNPEFAGIQQLFDRESKKQNKAALQTLLYSWMFQQKYPERSRFEPALMAVRKTRQTGAGVRLFNKVNREYLSYENINENLVILQAQLQTLLKDLFDPRVAFNQTEETDTCLYCDFAPICGRPQK